MARLYVYIAAIVLLASIVAGAYLYFQFSQSKIEALSAEVSAVKAQAAALSATNQSLLADMEEFKRLTAETSAKIAEIQQHADAVSATLAKHDLTELASRKPKLIEDTINRSSANYFMSLEALSK